MIPGITKENPHWEVTNTEAMIEPRMFPIEVCEFHIPMIRPRLFIHKYHNW